MKIINKQIWELNKQLPAGKYALHVHGWLAVFTLETNCSHFLSETFGNLTIIKSLKKKKEAVNLSLVSLSYSREPEQPVTDLQKLAFPFRVISHHHNL